MAHTDSAIVERRLRPIYGINLNIFKDFYEI